MLHAPRTPARRHDSSLALSPLGRRALLVGAGLALGGTAASALPAQRAFAEDAGLDPTGTTLEAVAVPEAGENDSYRRLTAGPGYAFEVREDALDRAPQASRADTRVPLAAFVQFTDLHVLDAQSPMRFEFLHDITGSAFRPQESLTTQGAVSLIERVNDLRRGPHTGRDLDCVVTTGDNTDNHEHVELDWFLALMNGGEITANTGADGTWEGVQTGGSTHYWHPGGEVEDRYAEAGFPQLPELLAGAMTTHASPGLDIPWFSVFGNHDDSISGTLPTDWDVLREMYTGSWKFTGFASETANRQLEAQVRTAEAGGTGEAQRQALSSSLDPERRYEVTPETSAASPSPPRSTSAPTWGRPRASARPGTASPRRTRWSRPATTPSRSRRGWSASRWTPPTAPASRRAPWATPSTAGSRRPSRRAPAATTTGSGACSARSPRTRTSWSSATTPRTR